MKILIVLAVVGAVLVLAAYLRKRAFEDFVPQDRSSEKTKNGA